MLDGRDGLTLLFYNLAVGWNLSNINTAKLTILTKKSGPYGPFFYQNDILLLHNANISPLIKNNQNHTLKVVHDKEKSCLHRCQYF